MSGVDDLSIVFTEEDWIEVYDGRNRWPNFDPWGADSRMRCACCDVFRFVPNTLDTIQQARRELGFSFHVTSGYRCQKHDEAEGGSGIHSLGEALDLHFRTPLEGTRFAAWVAYRICKLLEVTKNPATEINRARAMGRRFYLTGLGILARGGQSGRFCHVDSFPGSDEHPRPAIWTYNSKPSSA